jgi:hypothetical protein
VVVLFKKVYLLLLSGVLRNGAAEAVGGEAGVACWGDEHSFYLLPS